MEEALIKDLVGQKIKKYRKSLNFTQEKLGEKVGINQRQVALIENGKSFPSLHTLNQMAKIFCCSIKDFFEYEYLQNEKVLKNELKILVDKMNYKEIQTIYLIAKNL